MCSYTMRHLLRILLLTLVLLIGGIVAQTGQPIRIEHSTILGYLTAAEAQADFDALRNALEEAHGGLYRFSTKPALDRRFNAYRLRLAAPITKFAFISLMSDMVADIRDGHTRLDYEQAISPLNPRVFPFRVLVEGSRLMVLSNDTPADSTIRPGMEIIRINGRPARKLVNYLLPKLPGDGFIETGKKARLGRSFGLYYWLFVDQAEEFTVAARNAAGKTVITKLPGVLTSERNKNNNPVNAQMKANVAHLDGSQENVSLRFVRDPGIAYLRIRAFDGDSYPASLDTAFRTLRDQKTKTLILDLRGNNGGRDDYGALLIAQLTDKPFRSIDQIHLRTIRPSFATLKPDLLELLQNGTVPDPAGGYLATTILNGRIVEQAPAAHPFPGRLFVLLDGGTFSAASDVTARLRHLQRATFIGEESGGAYEGPTAGPSAPITLPHSKLRLNIHMFEYWNAVSPKKGGRGTLPDYVVERRASDLLLGVDVPLERAVALALRKGLSKSSRKE